MGKWQDPDTEALDAIYRATRPGVSRSVFIDTLERSGMLVRKAYYVPDDNEIFGIYASMRHDLYLARRAWRWVMCAETLRALAQRHLGKQVPGAVSPPGFVEAKEAAHDELYGILIVNPPKTTLFGISIRIDPAARKPMFEIDEL
jgi:hypothetical protein